MDLALGDPRFSWHPIRIMGMVIQDAEAMIRRHFKSLFLGGFGLAMGLPLACWFLTQVLLGLLEGFGWDLLPLAASAILIYFCLSIRDLGDHAMAVVRALREKDTK